MGPFMAINAIYKSGEVSKKSDEGEDDGLWILALGVKLAVITPPRGVSIELGSAVVIIFGSYLGLPLSTTHCQVGATTGVALLEGSAGVNKWVLGKTVVGWVITLVVVGVTTGILLAQGINSPLTEGKEQLLLRENCPTWATTNNLLSSSAWSTRYNVTI